MDNLNIEQQWAKFTNSNYNLESIKFDCIDNDTDKIEAPLCSDLNISTIPLSGEINFFFPNLLEVKEIS